MRADRQHSASAAKREKRAAKAGNKNGNPISLKSKVLAVISDPSSSESSVLLAESSGTVRRVNVETGDSKTVYRGPSAPVTCVAVGGPGNQTIFAGSWDKEIWTWDVASKAPGRKYSGHTDFVKVVLCGKIGGKDILISGGADKKIMVWDVATGSRLHVLQDQIVLMMAIQDLAIDPAESKDDEVIIASASSDPHIRRWRIRLESAEQITDNTSSEPGSVQHTILEHETTIYSLRFDIENPEFDLWTASGDGTAKCLSRRRGFLVEDTFEHGDHVRAVAVTDQWVITAGRDEDIKVWDRTSGKLYCTLEGHFDEVTALLPLGTASPIGGQLVSVSLDGTLRTWSLDKRNLDKIIQEQRDKAEGVEKETPAEAPQSLLSAEEEAELAALMEED